MPHIYSREWSDALLRLANSRDDLSGKVPQGEWRIAIEIEGDGRSPYVQADEVKNFYVHMLDGKIKEYRESEEKIPGKGLNYRITGPAAVFDGIAAGLYDLVEKGLDGSLVIRGDMRMLLQNADLANIIFEVYTESDLTEWPAGKPPYDA
ncbi:MAG: hypothetical protein GY866_12090 [Proteobacteria bacterium]|nr:hypothetical protein [Pseudomonadota bacterium]